MNKNKKGFTLTELIVVIVIIAILAAVLIPTLTGTVNKSRKSAASQEAASMNTAYQAWLIDTTEDGGYDEENDTTAIARLRSFASYYALQNAKTESDITYQYESGIDSVTATIAGAVIIYVGASSARTFTMQASNKYYVMVTASGETAYTVADAFKGIDGAGKTNDIIVSLKAVSVTAANGDSQTKTVTLYGKTTGAIAVSDNTTNATVAISGSTITITGVAAGTATVTVTQGSYTATISVTVA